MCDFATAAMIISGAAGVGSAVTQSNMSRSNAAMARYEAGQTAEIGRVNEMQAKSRMDRLIAQQRGQLIARGIDLSSTSVDDAGAEAARQGFMETQAQRYNTAQAVAAKTNEGTIYTYQASTGLMTGLAGTFTKSAGQALDLWPQLMGT